MLLFAVDKDGGTHMSDETTLDMFVPHLISGFACMNFLSTLSCDFDLVRGKFGCRPGTFTVYFGCRYLSVLATVTMLIYYDIFSAARIEALHYIFQALSSISLGFAFTIMAIRVSTLFPNVYLCTTLDFISMVFWVLLSMAMHGITSPWSTHKGIPVAINALMLLISTGAFVLGLVHVFYVCRSQHRFQIRACCELVCTENVPELALIWAVAIPATVLFFLEPSTINSIWHRFTITYGAFVVITVISCRIYRKMVQRLTRCPVVNYSPLVGWVKAVAVSIARNLSSDDNQTKGNTLLHYFCPRRPGPRVHHSASGRSLSFPTISGLRHAGRRRRESTCMPANSRTTYAHSSLYESRELPP